MAGATLVLGAFLVLSTAVANMMAPKTTVAKESNTGGDDADNDNNPARLTGPLVVGETPSSYPAS
ncbi:hypothetical protein [Candidatus Nitrososphaera evergladensis]|uniref:hypothetical protein n=1 Tax=Candidatus Nitrososphaera evergladensis TaxID=1459637 RepID=UPI0011E5A9CE|nr:hypothetical protein [Candidatus Nitrososphaera evergladensis]